MTEFMPLYKPRIPTALMREEKDGLHLLLHPERPVWAAVNHLGLQIVGLCDGEHTVQNIAATIATHYAQDLNRVQADVIAYLQQLKRTGLLLDHVPPEDAGFSSPHPIRLHINATEKCNLRCIHCAVTNKPAPPDALSTAEIYRLVDELSPANDDSLALSGGEPLLRGDALDILRYASQRVRTALGTNATLIDEDTAAALSELDLNIQISLDGASPAIHDRIRGKGTFDKTMHAVDMLRRHGFAGELGFSMTVMRPNMADVPNMIDLAERIEVGLRLTPLQKLGRADASWAEISLKAEDCAQLHSYIYRERTHTDRKTAIDGGLQGFIFDVPKRGVWCSIGISAAVDPEGNVHPCSLLMTPEFRLGNVKQASLRQIMASSRLQELERSCAARKTLIEKCAHCHWRNFCQASCPASVLLEKGTMLETDDLCQFRQHLYRETFFDLAQRKLKRENLATEQAC